MAPVGLPTCTVGADEASLREQALAAIPKVDAIGMTLETAVGRSPPQAPY